MTLESKISYTHHAWIFGGVIVVKLGKWTMQTDFGDPGADSA